LIVTEQNQRMSTHGKGLRGFIPERARRPGDEDHLTW